MFNVSDAKSAHYTKGHLLSLLSTVTDKAYCYLGTTVSGREASLLKLQGCFHHSKMRTSNWALQDFIIHNRSVTVGVETVLKLITVKFVFK